MKKLILFTLFLFAFVPSAFATWTLTPTLDNEAGHYLRVKVVCTSDGSSLSATDLVAEMNSQLKRAIQGSSLMIMKVSPGTGGVIPNTTINITLSDDDQDAFYATTGVSQNAVTDGFDLSTDHGQYPTVYNLLYLTMNDIGDAGDQVTLYIECWVTDK